jgi:hypothetical protein
MPSLLSRLTLVYPYTMKNNKIEQPGKAAPQDPTGRIGTARIGKLLFDFSIPAIVGMLVNAIYNIVDRIYVGQGVDPLGIAGITTAMPLMTGHRRLLFHRKGGYDILIHHDFLGGNDEGYKRP